MHTPKRNPTLNLSKQNESFRIFSGFFFLIEGNHFVQKKKKKVFLMQTNQMSPLSKLKFRSLWGHLVAKQDIKTGPLTHKTHTHTIMHQD